MQNLERCWAPVGKGKAVERGIRERADQVAVYCFGFDAGRNKSQEGQFTMMEEQDLIKFNLLT